MKKLEEMSDEEIQKLSDDELRELTLASVQQPRDESGRFTEKPAEKEPVVEPEEEIVYRKVIDLQDGSGVQVFEAPTMEELIDKLATAQVNATKKIREQAQALKDKPAPVAEPELTEEQKFIWQQRLLSDPSSVIREEARKMFEKEYGPKIKELDAAEVVRKGEITAQQWVDSNTEYFANERNGERMKKYLSTYKLDITAENLQKAFEDLNASGLLESRPQEQEKEKETNAEPEVEAAPVKRIVEPVSTVTTVRRKVVGGISTKRSAPVEKAAPGLTEADLYKLPMDELEQLALRSVR